MGKVVCIRPEMHIFFLYMSGITFARDSDMESIMSKKSQGLIYIYP